MPLGAAKNFLIDGKATFSNSQKMSLLNSWLAQGKSWADIPPAIKRHAKTEFKIPSALYGKLLPKPTTSPKRAHKVFTGEGKWEDWEDY